jgi:hypothetical protein
MELWMENCMIPRIAVLLLSIALCPVSSLLLANDYPKSLDEVRAQVEKLEMPTDFVAKGFYHDENTHFLIRCASNADLKIVVWERTESDGKHSSEAFVRSRSYFFTAKRTASDKPWLLTEFVSPINDKFAKLMEEEWKDQSRWLRFRELVGDNRLRALLAHPEIVAAKLEPPDSDGLVKLTIDVPNPDAMLPDEYASELPLWFKQAEVRLDPNQQYCVASNYSVHSRFDSTGTTKVLEWGEKDGRKYPVKTVRTHSKVGDLLTYEVTSIRFDEVPESEFTLEAFGIPNPYDSAPSDTLWSPTLIMAIAGVVFLGVGFAFRFAQKRRVA